MRLDRLFSLSTKIALVALAWLGSAGVMGCGKGCGKSTEQGRPRVAVSIFPVYDLTRRIAGPDADVALVIQAGESPHRFAPSVETKAQLKGVRLGVMVGLGLDPWMETLVKEGAPEARVLKVGDRVPTLAMRDARRGESADPDREPPLDPHVWLDPERAQLIARAIAEELSRVDTPHALDYRRRAAEVDAALAALDKEAETRMQALKARPFVTLHNGFQYFAERYKLEIPAVIETVPGTPPTSTEAAALAKTIKERNVVGVFREPQLDAAPATSIANDSRVRLGVLDPLGGTGETASYETLIRFDLGQLEATLR